MASASPRRAWQQPDPAFWQGKRVLLTGHTGFKGSWLALWLCELGAQVTGFALAPDTQPSLFDQLGLAGRLDHHIGDLRDPAALRELVAASQPEVVLHLAAQPLVRRSYAEPVLTWETNVLGTIHLIEALRPLAHPCAAVLITTDKVYRNNEWLYGYRENDPLGGHDPYSSSKAAAELAISSWRASYCGSLPHQSPHLRLASARAGNVIGGGDWAADRIIPDTVRSLRAGEPITLRNPTATRPWQHVLEPLGGYLALAEALAIEHHTLYQVSTSGALVKGLYQGCVSVADIRRHGDFGLGTFDGLDGEAILLDGVCWQARGDGSVQVAPDAALAPFFVATHFAADTEASFAAVSSFADLRQRLDGLRPSANLFVAIRLHGLFERIKVRTACKSAPGTDLVTATSHQA